ncbi:MAG: sugar phosphate isomerase/epimerase [Clostridia bacterium]|nr:sugar phosphate isomerase/epimerase [Clostridia bacterium]MBQ4452399.1 sugar phosphate isomerase/epimerase [Clostridia bacterium]MBR5379437.1 sugar phosphate isomerase/epimerase [Clostridia bacterium]
MEYGIQMYSVRDITKDDLRGALKRIADIGYRWVEFAGFFGHSAREVRGWLEEYGLKVSGTHTGLKELDEDFDATVQYHKTLGNRHYIIPGHDLSDQKKLDAFIEKVNAYAPVLAKEGIQLGYHNHSHEFQPNRDGSMIHEQLVCRTDLRLEIDTFWYYNATGFSAKGILERLKDRIDFIHIKDGFRGGEGKPLGYGQAPLREVYDTAKANNMLMVVESESLQPDGLTEARLCCEWLKAQEKQ